MAGWFERRIVRADLRDGDIVSSTGAGVVRYGEYLEDGRGGRIFWLVASLLQLVLFAGLPLVMTWSVWDRTDLDRGDPFRVGLMVVASLVSWWCALLWQGSVRAMLRGLDNPRREEAGEDE